MKMILLGLVILAGCTPSQPQLAPTPSSIDASFDQSWNAVIDVLAEYNVPVKTLDRSSGFVVAETSTMSDTDLSRFSSCGGILDLVINRGHPALANYNILVRGDVSSSTVKVTARFVHGGTTCSSKNVFEKSFQEDVKQRAESHTSGPRVIAQKQSSQGSVTPSTPSPTSRPNTTAVNALAEGLHSQANIGAPRSEEERQAAIEAFEDGQRYLGSHEWTKAEQSFQKALLYDGSVAKYHAALGALMMTLHRWVDAEASYSAAVLIDVDNAEYRRLLKEARARR
jgi:hypothetical protein